MPDLGLSTALIAIVLALVAAVMWGVSDFAGGLLGRRAPILGVLIATQAVGFVIAATITGLRGEPTMVGQDLWLALGGAVLGAMGVSSLYQGLAVGRMGIVAPVAAVLTAVTPALIGVVLQGVPPLVVIAGLAVAIVAVVTVSASPDDGSGRPTACPTPSWPGSPSASSASSSAGFR